MKERLMWSLGLTIVLLVGAWAGMCVNGEARFVFPTPPAPLFAGNDWKDAMRGQAPTLWSGKTGIECVSSDGLQHFGYFTAAAIVKVRRAALEEVAQHPQHHMFNINTGQFERSSCGCGLEFEPGGSCGQWQEHIRNL